MIKLDIETMVLPPNIARQVDQWTTKVQIAEGVKSSTNLSIDTGELDQLNSDIGDTMAKLKNAMLEEEEEVQPPTPPNRIKVTPIKDEERKVDVPLEDLFAKPKKKQKQPKPPKEKKPSIFAKKPKHVQEEEDTILTPPEPKEKKPSLFSKKSKPKKEEEDTLLTPKEKPKKASLFARKPKLSSLDSAFDFPEDIELEKVSGEDYTSPNEDDYDEGEEEVSPTILNTVETMSSNYKYAANSTGTIQSTRGKKNQGGEE